MIRNARRTRLTCDTFDEQRKKKGEKRPPLSISRPAHSNQSESSSLADSLISGSSALALASSGAGPESTLGTTSLEAIV